MPDAVVRVAQCARSWFRASNNVSTGHALCHYPSDCIFVRVLWCEQRVHCNCVKGAVAQTDFKQLSAGAQGVRSCLWRVRAVGSGATMISRDYRCWWSGWSLAAMRSRTWPTSSTRPLSSQHTILRCPSCTLGLQVCRVIWGPDFDIGAKDDRAGRADAPQLCCRT